MYTAYYSTSDQDPGMLLGFGETEVAAEVDARREVEKVGLEIDWADVRVLPCDESLDEGHPATFRVVDGHVYDAR